MVSAISLPHKHYFGLAPTLDEGPRQLAKTYTIAAAGTIPDNITKEIQMKEISFIQGFYFNNKLGGGIVTLLCRQAEMGIEFANKTQGFLPFFFPQEPEFEIIFAAAGTFSINFSNIPIGPLIWPTT